MPIVNGQRKVSRIVVGEAVRSVVIYRRKLAGWNGRGTAAWHSAAQRPGGSAVQRGPKLIDLVVLNQAVHGGVVGHRRGATGKPFAEGRAGAAECRFQERLGRNRDLTDIVGVGGRNGKVSLREG